MVAAAEKGESDCAEPLQRYRKDVVTLLVQAGLGHAALDLALPWGWIASALTQHDGSTDFEWWWQWKSLSMLPSRIDRYA